MTTFATRISDLIAALTAVIAPMATRDRARAAFLVLFCNSLDRMAQCFESLYQQWRDGTLVQPDPAGRAAAGDCIRPPANRAGHSATIQRAAFTAGHIASRQLTTPDVAAVRTAVPRAKPVPRRSTSRPRTPHASVAAPRSRLHPGTTATDRRGPPPQFLPA